MMKPLNYQVFLYNILANFLGTHEGIKLKSFSKEEFPEEKFKVDAKRKRKRKKKKKT